jgi:hypothetical protein
VDRRRLERNTEDSRLSLERALQTWRRLSDAWQSIFDGARAVRNHERMALAEAKREECKESIERIEAALHSHSAV